MPAVYPVPPAPPLRRKWRGLTLVAATLGVLLGVHQAHAAADRADNYEDALARAKSEGKDLVVYQRGSDWNRLSETLYREVWMKDEFAKELGDGFVLLAVDRPEAENGAAGARLTKLVNETAPLPPNEMTAVESEAKIPFTVRPDGAFLGGMTPNPGQDVLTLRLTAKTGGCILRLDFPMDPSLPGGGPGRVAHGNFAISEVEAQQGTVPVKLTAAWADAFDSDTEVDRAGNAYTLAVLQGARMDGAAFLADLAESIPDLGEPLRVAERAIRDEVQALSPLITLFPFPTGGHGNVGNAGLR